MFLEGMHVTFFLMEPFFESSCLHSDLFLVVVGFQAVQVQVCLSGSDHLQALCEIIYKDRSSTSLLFWKASQKTHL